ncbi:D-glycerate dehydrogenase [Alkalihalobacillus sp. AL-G]|uniref:2-hydroxyacid dehydrogenase n=1 Tax=Alkalihalobacillus sp. AL-G TaxID=2926399 RepID=UPI00272A89E3|nr:D-glycerate dehydrogenase [Alkalihalobacillus sp. AL-G]WLD93819.1 D-glycerate dehydrogenase [Alkalihalobacillus sp. AL-G]
MKPKIFITRKIPKRIVTQIEEVCEVEMWEEEDTPIPREVLEKKVEDIEGLFCLLTESIDEELLNKAKKLKIVSNMAVGYNNIDVGAAKERGITVTNTPGVLTETTADLTFALLMATSRRIVEASDYLRDGKWETWSPMQLTGQDVYGATLGIIGMGRIGQSVAKRAKGFDMNILYYNQSRKTEIEDRLGVRYVEMDQLLQESDFVVIMTPYTPETENLIAKRELAFMKESAILINTARGGIVDEEALYHALKNNEIWAAGLDVFETEPISQENPLLTLPNVVTVPHIGSASIKTRLKMAELAAENLINGVTDKKPAHVVV